MYNQELINKYASKFMIDHPSLKGKKIPVEYLTDAYLTNAFKDCAIPVRSSMLLQLRKAIMAKSMEGRKDKFWNIEEVKNYTLNPDDVYMTHRKGKTQIRTFGVFAGMDGQAMHWALSGWMHTGKAHLMVNEYSNQYVELEYIAHLSDEKSEGRS